MEDSTSTRHGLVGNLSPHRHEHREQVVHMEAQHRHDKQICPLSQPFVESWQHGCRTGLSDKLPWVDIVREYAIDSAHQPPPTFCRTGYGLCPPGCIKWMDGFFNLAASFVVAGSCICNSEAFFGCFITVLSMLFYWEYGQGLAVQMKSAPRLQPSRPDAAAARAPPAPQHSAPTPAPLPARRQLEHRLSRRHLPDHAGHRLRLRAA